MAIKQFTPPSMKGLNFNIDSDLIFNEFFGAIRKASDVGVLRITAGTDLQGNSGAMLQLVGVNNVSLWSGGFSFVMPDLLGSHNDFMGVASSASPYLNLLNHRIGNVGTPTTDGDALKYQAWADWTPTVTWGGATPTITTQTYRWMRIGKTVFLNIAIVCSDGKGATSVNITLPSTARTLAGVYWENTMRERVNTTHNPCYPYIGSGGTALDCQATAGFSPMTNGVSSLLIGQIFYEE
jgi:hypothetical protein